MSARPLDLAKPMQVRDGQPATILTTEARGPFPIVGYIGNSNVITSWKRDGGFQYADSASQLDLINVLVKHTLYINAYPFGGMSNGHSTRTDADALAVKGRVACIKVEYAEDQYDE